MQREIGPLAQLEGVRLDRSRHEPPAAADYAVPNSTACRSAFQRAPLARASSWAKLLRAQVRLLWSA